MKLITCDLFPFLSARDAGEKRAFRADSTADARNFEGPLAARADTTCPVVSISTTTATVPITPARFASSGYFALGMTGLMLGAPSENSIASGFGFPVDGE